MEDAWEKTQILEALLIGVSAIFEHKKIDLSLNTSPGVQKYDRAVAPCDQNVRVHLMRKFPNDVMTKISGCLRLISKRNKKVTQVCFFFLVGNLFRFCFLNTKNSTIR